MRVLNEQLYPYHIQPVQALQPADPQHRRAFSQKLLQQDAADPDFLSWVLVTDEACFTWNGILNSLNIHIWSGENLHSIQYSLFQHQFTVSLGRNNWRSHTVQATASTIRCLLFTFFNRRTASTTGGCTIGNVTNCVVYAWWSSCSFCPWCEAVSGPSLPDR
jgi:hypothetical protein